MIDPSKDKLAYFKDNFQSAEDEETFDASRYYYQREDFGGILNENMENSSNLFAFPELSDGNTLGSDFSTSSNVFPDFNSTMMSSNSLLFDAPADSSGLLDSGVTDSMNRFQGEELATLSKLAPDLSEFPALGSRMQMLSMDNDAQTQRSYRSSEFVVQKEDFPALFPGGKQEKSERGKRPSGSKSIGSHRLQGGKHSGTISTVSLTGETFFSSRKHPASRENIPGLDTTHRFGLLGMLESIVRPNESANITISYDLTTLGLDLNASEPLFATFTSPWSPSLDDKEPPFMIPNCYYNPPILKPNHFVKYQLETLFYVFYSMPKDIVQAYAAQELYARGWRYHSERSIWLKRANLRDFASEKRLEIDGADELNGAFVYFDANHWECRRLIDHENLESGLMSEESVRVKSNV
ncbi:unnamed protein product [Albugo candida]|uniref:NOT2/NOT3/NOT5 C-terminal domain-containing protein n=1 Tax=Albugo candida TaxID=65357 RepID=A0A024G4M5_9STRA|nr:unnamed protein product [Albugo candida]|eukprot:CCI41627.1 unnamed protein product [Albugo candida]